MRIQITISRVKLSWSTTKFSELVFWPEKPNSGMLLLITVKLEKLQESYAVKTQIIKNMKKPIQPDKDNKFLHNRDHGTSFRGGGGGG